MQMPSRSAAKAVDSEVIGEQLGASPLLRDTKQPRLFHTKWIFFIVDLTILNLPSTDWQRFATAICLNAKATCSGTRFRAWM